MKIAITLVLVTEKEANASRVVARLNEIIDANRPEFERDYKGGIKAHLSKPVNPEHWPDAFMSAISIAQYFGRSWTLLGHAEDELTLIGNEFSVPRIKWAEVSLTRR